MNLSVGTRIAYEKLTEKKLQSSDFNIIPAVAERLTISRGLLEKNHDAGKIQKWDYYHFWYRESRVCQTLIAIIFYIFLGEIKVLS